MLPANTYFYLIFRLGKVARKVTVNETSFTISQQTKYNKIFLWNILYFHKKYVTLDSGTADNRVVLAFILHRMEVTSMKHFDFKDLMAFGMFIMALLTFIYLISH